MIDLHAQGCRRLWASVMLTTLDDYNKRHAKAVRVNRGAAAVLEEARRYLESSNGRQVAALSGLEIPIGHALELIASPRAVFKLRTHVTGNRWTKEAE